jgi:serine/threonine-protein kinase
VAEALMRLHRLNVIHRDISPGNIMLSRAGIMKLADFGISRLCNDTLRITNGTTMHGNIPYMSPEQGNPQANTTDRSDIWSFAATMLEAWTGEVPYEGLNQYQIMRQHVVGVAPTLDCPARPLPRELRALLRQCFAIEPRKRPTARELVVVLCELRKQLEAREELQGLDRLRAEKSVVRLSGLKLSGLCGYPFLCMQRTMACVSPVFQLSSLSLCMKPNPAS